jgi:hypothetical protein
VLREHMLYAKFIKCEPFTKKEYYLGHVITEEGLVVDHDKIKAIMDCPTPKDVTDIRSFMWIEWYYRRLIKGFSEISYPITFVQKKEVKFREFSTAKTFIDQCLC